MEQKNSILLERKGEDWNGKDYKGKEKKRNSKKTKGQECIRKEGNKEDGKGRNEMQIDECKREGKIVKKWKRDKSEANNT